MSRRYRRGGYHTAALRDDGKVVAVGYNDDGETDVSSWENIIAISAGGYHTVGLTFNRRVIAAGYGEYGETDVVTNTAWTGGDIAAVSAGAYHTVGLKEDGTVIAVGLNNHGQTDVSGAAWTKIIAVSAGYNHTVALKSDGTAVATGDNSYGQTDVATWTNLIAVSAGNAHTVGLKSDGTVVAVGWNLDGETNVATWTDIVAIAAGGYHTAALKSDGTLVMAGFNGDNRGNVATWQLNTPGAGVKGAKGTQVILPGSGFGSRKGAVIVGSAAAKIVSWFDTRIVFQTTAAAVPGEQPIFVAPAGGSPVLSDMTFVMQGPEMQLVQPNEGRSGDLIVITGKYFGSKKGSILLGSKSVAATYWYMDPSTGESIAAFRVPPRMTLGSYNPVLINESGWANLPTRAFLIK